MLYKKVKLDDRRSAFLDTTIDDLRAAAKELGMVVVPEKEPKKVEEMLDYVLDNYYNSEGLWSELLELAQEAE